MGRFVDLTGQRFGRLTAVGVAGKRGTHTIWRCECDCGESTKVQVDKLRSGHTRSCGCIHREQLVQRNTVHDGAGTRLYWAWAHIKDRCNNEACKDYSLYGGRGIQVCDEWTNDFMAFRDWALANGYSEDLSIDRINVNGNYEPSNCRWATAVQQANNKRSNHRVQFNGETHTLTEWERITGIQQSTIRQRLKAGWSVERALTELASRYRAG